ncbi:hypothetical protein T05_12569 [Trichinella murrelli]|uniref:Uncharacterized protein n=1 Tax=Trichinella murrelli TaxID=144512 RepID=A0A0V0T8E7_9BILA|nr:hypothetical protein T05_12569 [Trichinella murrelli]
MIEGTGEKNNCTIELLNKICATKWFQQRKGKECMSNVILAVRKIEKVCSIEFSKHAQRLSKVPPRRSGKIISLPSCPRDILEPCCFKITDICQYV